MAKLTKAQRSAAAKKGWRTRRRGNPTHRAVTRIYKVHKVHSVDTEAQARRLAQQLEILNTPAKTYVKKSKVQGWEVLEVWPL